MKTVFYPSACSCFISFKSTRIAVQLIHFNENFYGMFGIENEAVTNIVPLQGLQKNPLYYGIYLKSFEIFIVK